MEQLLRSTAWRFSQSHGCCGLFELYRLKASYTTEEEMLKRHKAIVELGLPVSTVQKNSDLHFLLQNMLDSDMGWAVPVEWGFAAILSKLKNGTRANLILLSDNLDDEGDVHIGPFGTKHFVKWLKEMDVGEVHDTPARKSHRGRQPYLQAWIWHPDWDKVETAVRHALKLALEYYKEIKDVEKDLDERRRDANAEVLRTICQAAGWE